MIYKITFLVTISLISAESFGQTIIKKIKPDDTDPRITTYNTDSHYVYINTSAATKNMLVIYLPGTGGKPKNATYFGNLAADLGFHTIGLMYPNFPTVASICKKSTDADCYENVRREIVEGIDYTNQISVSSDECILNRIQKLLIYLNANYPSENWGRFLDADQRILFHKVIFAGHSQGGGHCALIAKYYPIKRALCFSSPGDWWDVTDAPSSWLSTGNWATSKSEIYCFNHVLDNHSSRLVIWDSLGLNQFGSPVNVDDIPPPYNNTRQLTTSYNVPNGNEHGSTVQDEKTPKVAGVPVFIPVWTYMLTGNAITNLTNESLGQAFHFPLFPNPVNDILNIDLTEENFRIKVFDPTGKCILDENSTGGKTQIKLSFLKSGLYFIQVTNGKSLFTGRIIKQ